MAYNEEVVAAFEPVRETIIATKEQLPLMKQRRCNGILNAITMLIEEDDLCKDAYTHLRSSLIALARFNGRADDADRIKAACQSFEAHPACRML